MHRVVLPVGKPYIRVIHAMRAFPACMNGNHFLLLTLSTIMLHYENQLLIALIIISSSLKIFSNSLLPKHSY
jgi:hypothetical protein